MAPIWSFQPLNGFGHNCVSVVFLSSMHLLYPERPPTGFKLELAHLAGPRLLFPNVQVCDSGTHGTGLWRQSRLVKKCFVTAKPGSSDKYTGILKHPLIKPVPFGAIWFPNAPTAEDIQTRKFVLHLPGEAYVIKSPPSTTGVFPSSVFSEKINAITFYAQYRVAATPDTRFPATIQDAVTFYAYLLDLGIPDKNIILSRDSARENLVIALLRYIEANKGLSRPCGAMSWSPWVNVTKSVISAYK